MFGIKLWLILLAERDAPTRPEPFYKTSTALIGPGDPIKIHPEAGLVACESELEAYWKSDQKCF